MTGVDADGMVSPPRWVTYLGVVLALLVGQSAASAIGSAVAGTLPAGVDPGGWYAALGVHHVAQGALALAAIVVCRRFLGLDFGLRLGDVRRGLTSVVVVVALLTSYLVGYHLALRAAGVPEPPVAWPSRSPDRMGLVAFQLLLTGPSEELLFRALPVVTLAAVASVTVVRAWGLTLEVLVAAALFALGHVTLSGGAVAADPAQLAFATVLGVVQGIVLQRTGSVVYPMAIHSLSNVLVLVTALAFA